ncbi:YoaK family protein [Tunturiibacter lichenicola]|uniref:YoaK family protein n=1 Tax=Tunturiibacter lichenicola TaxID=2051959 RepID=UPI0021B2F90B|nr:YoaK family protein [Edaphobacter lichenicola]
MSTTTGITVKPNALPDAMLLATTGGLLDAFIFLNHGHVFANAMTGNVVFLGIALIGRDWKEIVPHLVPICGFIVGVAASKRARSHLQERPLLLLGLSFEIVVLFALGWLPIDAPHMVFAATTAIVGAFQVASYRHVEGFGYNSTFITGNLRDTVEGFYDAITPGVTPEVRDKGRAKALDLGLICLCFLAGAVIGAWAAPRFANHTLWFAEPFLFVVALRALSLRA